MLQTKNDAMEAIRQIVRDLGADGESWTEEGAETLLYQAVRHDPELAQIALRRGVKRLLEDFYEGNKPKRRKYHGAMYYHMPFDVLKLGYDKQRRARRIIALHAHQQDAEKWLMVQARNAKHQALAWKEMKAFNEALIDDMRPGETLIEAQQRHMEGC